MPTGVFVRTTEYRAKLRKIALQNGSKPPSPKGTVWTAERKAKLSLKRKGKPRPLTVRRIMEKTYFKKGVTPSNKGKEHLPAEKNPQWKGGISLAYRTKTAPRPKPDQCEVCGAFGKDFKKGLCFDHDHQTGVFRGWLCTRCNVTLGMVKDNVETLMALSDYLKNSRSASGYKGA